MFPKQIWWRLQIFLQKGVRNVEMFVMCVCWCQSKKDMKSFWEIYIFQKFPWVVDFVQWYMSVYKQINLEHCMQCTILWRHVQYDVIFPGNEKSLSQKTKIKDFAILNETFQLSFNILLWQCHQAVISRNFLTDKSGNTTSYTFGTGVYLYGDQVLISRPSDTW